MTDDSQDEFAPTGTLLDDADLFPIREVSRMTGVNPVTLRAWERRYGLLTPHRTESGHRLYSMADVERVRAVMAWIERGVAVSKVATIIDRTPRPEAMPRPLASPPVDVPQGSEMEAWQARLLQAANDGNLRQLDSVYGQLHASFPLPVVVCEVLRPVWQRLRGKRGSQPGIAWLLIDSFLTSRLTQRASFMAGYRHVLLVNLSGPQQPFDVLCAASLITATDTDVICLREAPPLLDLAVLAERTDAAAVILFSDRAQDNDMLGKQLPRLEQSLACPLVMLGDCCEAQESALEKAGLHALGEISSALPRRLAALLAGRLDH
ncbi:MAG: MerR family transcriptional regulator [Pseudomonadaceae bacterium]|nr:MAG: MerR family transcriptional regulator [Pseudomonadaceae bacterium]